MKPFPTSRPLQQLLFHIQEPECNGYDFHYHLGEPSAFVIGRGAGWEPSDAQGIRIDLKDARVSRQHCRIFADPKEGWMIEDLGSTNGTFVAPLRHAAEELLRVSCTVHLPARAIIQVGYTLLAVRPLPNTKTMARKEDVWGRHPPRV
ncbi:MAG: FHA domain-containing protein [Magnetococcales bacterium]|nr:FHA domain-containing protein [Magnetococcales bacterium]